MWQYNYNYGDELYHHGVLGMRWGHRKDPKNYSPRRMARALNRADQKRTEQLYSAKRHESKFSRKYNRIWSKYEKNPSKSQKYAAKYNPYIEKNRNKLVDKYTKVIDTENYMKSLLSVANAKGYTVEHRNIRRIANTGQMTAAYMLAGPLAAVAVSKLEPGRFYKVKRPKG